MVDNRFPQPFDESYIPPPQEERQAIRGVFDDSIEQVMLRYFDKLDHFTRGKNEIVTKVSRLALSSLDEQSGEINMTVMKAETGGRLGSSMAYMRWISGARMYRVVGYFVDITTGDVVRKDSEDPHEPPTEGDEKKETSTQETLPAPLELPVHMAEVEWVAEIIANAKPLTDYPAPPTV